MKTALGDNKRRLVNTKFYAVDRVFFFFSVLIFGLDNREENGSNVTSL